MKIRITHLGEFYIGIGIDIFEDQWEEVAIPSAHKSKSGAVVDHPMASRYNNKITAQKLGIDRRLLDLEESGRILKMNNTRLKEYLTKDSDRPGLYLFREHYEKFCAGKTRSSTLDTLTNTYINVSRFANIGTLAFAEMNYEWLKSLDKFMEDRGLSINGRGVYMRNIRAISNDAIKCDYVSLGDYPFRKFTIKTEKTRKRSLTVEQLRTLRDYSCEEYQGRYRDLFLLTFYLLGVNAIDLFGAAELANGRLEYRRAKTGRLYSIKVEPEAMTIIDRYRGKDYLLDVLDRYEDYKDFLRRMNQRVTKDRGFGVG